MSVKKNIDVRFNERIAVLHYTVLSGDMYSVTNQ